MKAPGWYVDPDNITLERWWDGWRWGEHSRARYASSPPAALALTVASPPPTEAAAPPQSAILAVAMSPQANPNTKEELERCLAQLRQQIVQTGDIVNLQEVGIYNYSHPLDDSAQYKDELANIDQAIAAMVKQDTAVTSVSKWQINGSDKAGLKMLSDFKKMVLRAYNAEADNIVRTLKPYALPPALARLDKQRETLKKLGTMMKLEIAEPFHALRMKEIQLTADYKNKQADEKEKQREERARLKEEERARKELEVEHERLNREREKAVYALELLVQRGDVEGVAKMQAQCADIDLALQSVIEREANAKAGYVYVISNVGSFGNGIVKIGMTRRVDPMDRIRELGDASVPFRFDVHTLFYSDSAADIEAAMHRYFADKRVNLINMHREYFYVTPLEAKQAILEQSGNLLSYEDVPEALEFRQSQNLRQESSVR